MSRETGFHFLITAMALVTVWLLQLLPEPAAGIVGLFSPTLFFAVLIAILCGPVYAGFFGVAAPLIGFFLFRSPAFFPEVLSEMISFGIAGITAGLLYYFFRTSVGTAAGSILSWILSYALSKLTALIVAGESYDFLTFLTDVFLKRGLGIVLTMSLIPLLIVRFRKKRIMWVLRRERLE